MSVIKSTNWIRFYWLRQIRLLRLFIRCPVTTLLIICLIHTSGIGAEAQGEAYRIGKGDVLSVLILVGGNEEHNSELTVSEQGTVKMPFLGFVKVGGLTVSQLEKVVTDLLARDYFVDPQVNINVKEYHSLHYYLTGAVNNPGLYEMTSKTSVLELIAKAGGVAETCGYVGYILRGKEGTPSDIEIQNDIQEMMATPNKPIMIDLRGLLDKGDMSKNLMLQPGDVVYLPFRSSLDIAESKVYVEGEVNSPGAYDYQEGLTALSACIMAGGFKEFAAPNRTKIIRPGDPKPEVIKINLNHVQKGRIPDVELEPGDRIHIPESWL